MICVHLNCPRVPIPPSAVFSLQHAEQMRFSFPFLSVSSALSLTFVPFFSISSIPLLSLSQFFHLSLFLFILFLRWRAKSDAGPHGGFGGVWFGAWIHPQAPRWFWQVDGAQPPENARSLWTVRPKKTSCLQTKALKCAFEMRKLRWPCQVCSLKKCRYWYSVWCRGWLPAQLLNFKANVKSPNLRFRTFLVDKSKVRNMF